MPLKTVVYGAGQGGRMARRLLSAAYEVTAWCDGNAALWGAALEGLPVLSPDQLLRQPPDCVVLGMLNREAADSVGARLRAGGYEGELLAAAELRARFDLRLATVRLLAEALEQRRVAGDIAELGVYRGDLARELNALFPLRTLHLFDTFTGFDARDTADADFADTSPELVRSRLPHPERAVFHIGYFPESIPAGELHFALVSLDTDLEKPTAAGLRYFWPRLAPGGALLLHDYNSAQYPGVRAAADAFCAAGGLFLTPLCDLHGSALLRKAGET